MPTPSKLHPIVLQLQPETFSICQLSPTTPLPNWLDLTDSFVSITRTEEETSIVCEQSLVPEDIKAKRGWRMLKVKGTLDFSLTGVLERILNPLAKYVSVFALSTYNTDYILVKREQFDGAVELLSRHFEIECFEG